MRDKNKLVRAIAFSLTTIILAALWTLLISKALSIKSLSPNVNLENVQAQEKVDVLLKPLVLLIPYMYIPFIVSLIFWIIFERKTPKEFFVEIGVKNVRLNKWYFIAVSFPLIAFVLTALFSVISGLAVLQTRHLEKVLISLVAAPVAGSTVNAITAFGEESGWRGYLFYLLREKRRNFRAAFTGIVWGLWHTPIILLGYNYDGFKAYGIPLMVLATLAFSFISDKLRSESDSLWPSSVFHGTINAVGGLPLTVVTPSQKALSIAGPHASNMLLLFSSMVGLFGAVSFALLYLLIADYATFKKGVGK